MAGKRVIMVVLGIVFLSGIAFAEEKGDEIFHLGEVVVTGEAEKSPAVAIRHTITPAEIKAANSQTVAEALKFAPGIVMARGRKNEPEISVHGFAQEKTLFLIDGIPYYETYYGKLNLDQIPVEIISKIEVTKNAPSVLYGANAQVAVVNIVTKQGTEKPSFQVSGEMGEDDTYSTTVSHGNQVGDINYWLSYIHRESDGWSLSHDFNPEIAQRKGKWMPDRDGVHEDGGRRENSDYETDKLWARFGIEPTENSEYFFSFHMLTSEMGHPLSTQEYKLFPRKNDDPAFSTFARFEDYDDWGIDLSGRHRITDWLTVRGKLFYHDHEDQYESYDSPDFDRVIAKSTYKDSITGGSLFTDFTCADWHQGHFSLHYKQDIHEEKADEYLPYNDYESVTGSFGTEHSFFGPGGLKVVAGVSYDWFDVKDAEDYNFDGGDNFLGQTDKETSSAKDELNPMIGVEYNLDQTTFYASAAKKTRFPTLTQLYSEKKGGNPDLSAEETINYTLGVKQSLGTWMSLDVSGFYHDIDDWISNEYETDAMGNDIYKNVAEICMKGVEASLVLRPVSDVRLNLNYTYNDAENESSNRVTDKVIGVAEQKFGVGCRATIPVILVDIDLQGIYVDEMYEALPPFKKPSEKITETDDYFILNGRLERTFFDRVDGYVEVDNIFDKDYEQEGGFPGRGRNIRVGLKAEF